MRVNGGDRGAGQHSHILVVHRRPSPILRIVLSRAGGSDAGGTVFVVIVAGASRTCCLVVPCGGRGGVGSSLASWVRRNVEVLTM
jgi:hypothetical protein